LLLTRIDSSIDFGGSIAWPADGSRPAPKSIRWTGWVKAPMTGRYQFHFDLPDARVQVARQTVAGTNAPREAFLDLIAGRFYPISVELGTIDGDRMPRIRLEWTAPHGARYVVPRALLNLPTDTAKRV
jgi:hypothetical protein